MAIDPKNLLELTEKHKKLWYKNEIPITQEERRYYKCANPDGPVDNSNCPEDDPYCNCPAKYLQPKDAFIISSQDGEAFGFSKFLEDYSSFWNIAAGAIIPGYLLYDVINAAYEELNADPRETVYVVVDSLLEKLGSFRTYEEAEQFVENEVEVSPEPTSTELEELLQESKLCDAIESYLGEDWLGCEWDEYDDFASCNCPNVGGKYKKWKEYVSTYSTFWDTPKDTPLLRNAQMTLINAQKAQMTVAGDFNLKPGQIIKIEIKDIDQEGNEKSKSASGKWLVDTVTHFIEPQTHKMQVTLTRDSSYVDLEDYSEV